MGLFKAFPCHVILRVVTLTTLLVAKSQWLHLFSQHSLHLPPLNHFIPFLPVSAISQSHSQLSWKLDLKWSFFSLALLSSQVVRRWEFFSSFSLDSTSLQRQYFCFSFTWFLQQCPWPPSILVLWYTDLKMISTIMQESKYIADTVEHLSRSMLLSQAKHLKWGWFGVALETWHETFQTIFKKFQENQKMMKTFQQKYSLFANPLLLICCYFIEWLYLFASIIAEGVWESNNPFSLCFLNHPEQGRPKVCLSFCTGMV